MAFKTIFDPDFKYRPADSTDVRLTFARVRREQRRAQQPQGCAPPNNNVVPLGSAPHRPWPFTSGGQRAAG